MHDGTDEEEECDVYLSYVRCAKGWGVGKKHEVGREVCAGRLKNCEQFWRYLGASEFILKIIKFGYALPFLCLPADKEFKNHASVSTHREFVEETVSKLVLQGCAIECKRSDISIVSPLGVVDNGKKLRLILDLRYINQFLQKQKFKLEDLRTASQIYRKGDFLVTFDLKSGYHHIPISKSYWRFLGFSVGSGQTKRFFVFTVLPFGLATAPWVFTKVTRVLTRHWRSLGFRCMMYMDDGSAAASSPSECQKIADHMRLDLEAAGFLVNEEKSHWVPSRHVELLGHELDLSEGIIRVTARRVEKLKKALVEALRAQQVTARELARISGYILSMSLALGPVCRLHTRYLYRLIDQRQSWSAKVLMTVEAKEELRFWLSNFESLHGQPLWKSCQQVAVLSWSDASDTGWGGYCLTNGVKVAKGEWPPQVMLEGWSSTKRELRAVCLALESYGKLIQGQECIHRSDNQAAVRIIEVGSRHAHLQQEALAIHKVCGQFSIRLRVEWVPRESNQLADLFSKTVDTDDWMVRPSIFEQLDRCWGPHTLDVFASLRTKQLERFCSRWYNPGCFAVDAFSVAWGPPEVLWLVPPVYLIGRVISMIEETGAAGTLIVPGWVSAPWWPRICISKKWTGIVQEAIELQQEPSPFLAGHCKWNLFGADPPKCRVWALRVRGAAVQQPQARPRLSL